MKTLEEFPEIFRQWDGEKNDAEIPERISSSSHRRVWWKCEKGHEWQAQISSRTRGSGCPVCSNRRALSGENDLESMYPDLAKQWNVSKNGSLDPKSIVAGSHTKVWWICEKGHEWQATVLSRSRGAGCPVCAGKRVISGENDLASVFPLIAEEWHPTKNGGLSPDKVTPFSNRRVWWMCEKGHEYRAAVSHRTQERSNCPYCKGRKVLAGFNDLATKEPLIAAQWYSELNGALTPQMVTAASHKKVWWQCSDGHVWKATIASRTGTKKSGCPVCAGKVKIKKYS